MHIVLARSLINMNPNHASSWVKTSNGLDPIAWADSDFLVAYTIFSYGASDSD